MTTLRAIVISGPSGSGKSTLLQKLFQDFPGCFEFSVSHTTRKPRAGESDGKDYFFVERGKFEKMITDGEFLEHAQFSGNLYGTSKMAVTKVQESGKLCILDVEINGVKNIKKTDLDARYFFVQPPSLEALEKRLRGRGTESEDSLQKRLATVKEAMDYAKEPGAYDHIIVNDDLDVAYEKLKGILSSDLHEVQANMYKKGS